MLKRGIAPDLHPGEKVAANATLASPRPPLRVRLHRELYRYMHVTNLGKPAPPTAVHLRSLDESKVEVGAPRRCY